MNRVGPVLIATVVCLLVTCCNYSKPHMYVTITNNSAMPIRNLEVQYPCGSYGMSSLGNDQTNRRLIQIKPPCEFTVRFDSDTGAGEPHRFDFGESCPKEVIFTVDKQMKVSRRIVQP